MRLKQRRIISLIDLVRGEVRCIDVASQAGLEWSTDATERVELNTSEEAMALDLVSTATAESVLGVAD